MSRLQRLYQATILEHNKNPRHFGVLDTYTHHVHGRNPLCGDDYILYLFIDEGDCIQQVSFVGKGCAISKASGSMMAECVLGQSVDAVVKQKDLFLNLLHESCTDADKGQLGALTVFEGVCAFPARVKCAALIWRALEQALTGDGSVDVSTE